MIPSFAPTALVLISWTSLAWLALPPTAPQRASGAPTVNSTAFATAQHSVNTDAAVEKEDANYATRKKLATGSQSALSEFVQPGLSNETQPDQPLPRRANANLWLNLAILTAAAFIQATVGFAAALFGIPLLLWAGNDLMSAQVMTITAMLPQNILSVWKLRHSIDYREVALPATIRIAALPIGIAGLGIVLAWSAARVDQLVGAIILVAVLCQTLVGFEWKSARRLHWMLITFGGSGILQGLSGMSGPPMVLWVHGQRYSGERARAFLFAMYITNYLPQTLILYARFGHSVVQAAAVAILSLPFVLLATLVGLKFGSRLGERWLRPFTYACLIALAVRSLLRPWL